MPGYLNGSWVARQNISNKFKKCVDICRKAWYPNQALNESGMNKPKDLMRLLAGRQKSA